MSVVCNFDGCAVGETGVCALEHDPATCDHRVGTVAADAAGAPQSADVLPETDDIGGAVLERPSSTASFPSSHTLGPDVISDMMASRYVTMVGILGDPDSGKTACLASIYLLVANATLTGWTFADSRSLMAFEDIARGARDWNAGTPPDQMTVHTEMSDDRRPGFLHLRLIRKADGRRVDLALPDLPGEWTTKLISSAQAERFGFMKSAEALWIVVDGRALADKERRQGAISRVGQLAERLKTLFDGAVPRLVIVVTHRDGGELAEVVSTRLSAELQQRDVEFTVVHVAPFSENDSVRAGFGIDDLIDVTVGAPRAGPDFWPSIAPSDGARAYLAFRRDR